MDLCRFFGGGRWDIRFWIVGASLDTLGQESMIGKAPYGGVRKTRYKKKKKKKENIPWAYASMYISFTSSNYFYLPKHGTPPSRQARA